MSCAYAPSSPAEAPFTVFSKPTKTTTISQNISFSSNLTKSRISIQNPSGPLRDSRASTRTMAFYTPTESAETLYGLLGIGESGSTLSDIKKAYKQMARKYHPDVSPPDRVDEHTQRFIMVQRAYETLSDPQSRALYDRDLANGSSFGFSTRSRPYHYNQGMEETGEWRMRWNSQIDELKQKNMNPNSRGGRMTWGARMRNQR